MAEQSKSKNTWLTILIAAIVIAGIFVVAVIGGTAYFVASHVHTEPLSAQNAGARFLSERQRFAGQMPLIELPQIGEAPVIHRPPTDQHPASIVAVRALVYSQNEGKLVDVSLPFWILRLSPGNQLAFLDQRAHFGQERVRLTLQDLERHGPGLILDATDRNGSQILIWAE